jgi:serine/threonine protein kinase
LLDFSLDIFVIIPRLCGFPPFFDENNASLFAAIKAGEFDYPEPYWDDVSDVGKHILKQFWGAHCLTKGATAKDFINSLLKVDSKQRLTADTALNHEWISVRSVRIQVCGRTHGVQFRAVSALSTTSICRAWVLSSSDSMLAGKSMAHPIILRHEPLLCRKFKAGIITAKIVRAMGAMRLGVKKAAAEGGGEDAAAPAAVPAPAPAAVAAPAAAAPAE